MQTHTILVKWNLNKMSVRNFYLFVCTGSVRFLGTWILFPSLRSISPLSPSLDCSTCLVLARIVPALNSFKGYGQLRNGKKTNTEIWQSELRVLLYHVVQISNYRNWIDFQPFLLFRKMFSLFYFSFTIFIIFDLIVVVVLHIWDFLGIRNTPKFDI